MSVLLVVTAQGAAQVPGQAPTLRPLAVTQLDERRHPEQRKMPILGHLPGIGSAFRRETTSTRKTDLVILLTPTVMMPARVAQATGTALEKVR